MATYYKIGAGNFDDANAWSTNSAGPGDTQATDSGGGIYIVGSASNTLDLNGQAVTMNQSFQCTLLQSGNASGSLTLGALTKVINGDATHTAAKTTGMIILNNASSNLTVNGKLTQSTGVGYLVVGSTTAQLSVNKAAADAIVESISTGRVVSWTGTGNLSVTGNITGAVSAVNGLYITGACTTAINGKVYSASGAYSQHVFINSTGGTCTITAPAGTVAVDSQTSSTTGCVYTQGTVALNINGASGQITCKQYTSAGYSVNHTSTGTLTISAATSSDTAISCSSSGRGMSCSANALVNVTGITTCSGNGYGMVTSGTAKITVVGDLTATAGAGCPWYHSGTYTTGTGSTLTGNITVSSAGATGLILNAAGKLTHTGNMTVSNGTAGSVTVSRGVYFSGAGVYTIDGEISVDASTGLAVAADMNTASCSFTWTGGSRTNAVGKDITFLLKTGTLNLTDVKLMNYGRFLIMDTGSATTVTLTRCTILNAHPSAWAQRTRVPLTGTVVPYSANPCLPLAA